jgi:hypothetical protein
MTMSITQAPAVEAIAAFKKTVSGWRDRAAEHLDLEAAYAVAAMLAELGDPAAAHALLFKVWSQTGDADRDPWPWVLGARRFPDRPLSERYDGVPHFAPRYGQGLRRALTAIPGPADSYQQKDFH